MTTCKENVERGFGKKVKLKGPGRLKIERKQFLHVDEAYVAIKKQQQPILLRKEEREKEVTRSLTEQYTKQAS